MRPAPLSSSALSASPPSEIDSSSISRRLPRKTVSPLTSACAPLPSRLRKSRASGIFSPSALSRIARASGCSDPFSTAAASSNTCSGMRPSAATISTTRGSPIVKVPVLSKITTLSFVASSSADAFLNRMPRLAPSPVPTMTAIGVASPSASGQAITKTVIVRVTANSNVSPIHQNQTANVPRPMTIAIRTSHCDARSASNCAGALEFCASCTSFTICASAVSAPTLVAR